ncbi:MAG: transposase, partial [Armatimonadota bacterium]|nr:transposase [Armatimonadota bacterium]
KPPRETPRDRDQYNFTDPDSHIMKMADGAFAQAYNVQVAVDRTRQIIVATTVTAQSADAPHLPTMVAAIQEHEDAVPRRLTADAGYFSETNVQVLHAAHIQAWIPPDKRKHSQPIPSAPRGRIPKHLSTKDRMRRTLQTKVGRSVYRMHKAIAEPVLGQIKAARGFRQFLLRGLRKVGGEWTLVATVHNICKLFHVKARVRRVLAMG